MNSSLLSLKHPLAITMWDFSWLERRWPGAGYEDWDLALDQLVERGYNAVRIDAYPHFVAREPEKAWTILPCWNTNVWGSPATNHVRVQPELNQFLRKCRDRGILVGLSSWFQKDLEEANLMIPSPERLGEIWKMTLDTIAADGLLDTVLYVDLCNEWPFKVWAPFFNLDGKTAWKDELSLKWMRAAIAKLKQSYPQIPCTFSHVGLLNIPAENKEDLRFLDCLDAHVWMAAANQEEFNKRINYNYARFDPKDYENVVRYAQPLYEADPDYWHGLLRGLIDEVAQESSQHALPLITTECWSIIDYKDWPLLDWEWVKRSCAVGVEHAASKGRWVAMATSNFCGPQFVGMWRDIEWHRRQTELIKSAAMPPVPGFP